MTISLDANRAKSIIQSSDSINVMYNGNPVWLESVDGENTAEVTYLQNRKREKVPVDRLIEDV